jgi:2-aminobenzoate-CoA ligase
MKDIYPVCSTIPDGYLVPPEFQPEYLEIPGLSIPDSANVGLALSDEQVALGRGNGIALIYHEAGTTLTYSDLALRSGRLARALVESGIQPGQRVAFRFTNRPEAVIAAIAAWKIGAIVVPVPMQARAAELDFFVGDTTPTAMVALTDEPELHKSAAVSKIKVRMGLGKAPASGWQDLNAILENGATSEQPESFSSDSVAFIWHTGGTTGVPKACYHTHRRFLLGGRGVQAVIGVRPGERWAAAAPVGHALGFIYHTIFTLLHGATAVLIEGFARPDVLLAALSAHRVHTFAAITASWAKLHDAAMAQPEHKLALKRGYAMWQSASSSQVQNAWLERGITLLNNFGSTAFANWVLCPGQDEVVPRASLGRPTPGYKVRAVEPDSREIRDVPKGTPGRMAVRGPTGLTYWNRPDFQRRDVVDGWNLVDDMIQFGDDGNAAYLGRTDFIISTAGYKVTPVEVENVLVQHPAIAEACVVGAPDPLRQEVVAAFVALRPGTDRSDALKKELQAFAQERLSPYKYPRRIEFVDALPRDPVGKVQPRVLKDRLANEARQSTGGGKP